MRFYGEWDRERSIKELNIWKRYLFRMFSIFEKLDFFIFIYYLFVIRGDNYLVE